ncbi:MAG: hydroxymyristoyl-ACP dehydratase [Flavobacterium sp. BFFFF1]|uniref:3-hydroxyacyl-ACP dehydratase FabZ family protein n=1 Tax=Flavobacterium sp. BFFFF1 TaxID=2015557 RepID=UPI000BD61554|nr:FabA/FabZ family ACP-dehydratase [Flavobacterium sp. BFFFF1]OYU79035.1 MAG: hydroxymyristoyl-ACP dehydratase [Flavobacterium sp. BFFFF1]
MVTMQHIISKLPYTKPFLFVDQLTRIDENGVEGTYTYTADHDFFKGHFKGNPIVPGVILTETMAQIGVVCLGIFLLNDELNKNLLIALSSTHIDFLKPVFPDESVTVISHKIYFRFGKLKCDVKMLNELGETICEGTIAGMIVNRKET